MAGQVFEELETSPARASLGQGLMAPGADVGSWAMGEPQGAGQGQWGLVVCPGAWHCHSK